MCLTAAACAPTTSPVEGTPTVETTQVTTQASTTTTSSTPDTQVAVGYELGDCEVPPVDFALLCDVYDYIDSYHVDAPFDAASLAAGAAVGIDALESDGAGEAVTDFSCAVPDPAFESSCRLIASRIASGSISISAAVEAAVASMIDLSLDPFTYYIPPELSGALSDEGVVLAVGLLLTITNPADSVCRLVHEPCELSVTVAIQDGAAAEAGIIAGDTIVAIGGEDVDGLSLVDVAALLDGEPGTTIAVVVEHADGSTESANLVRQERQGASLEVELAEPGVGYIRIPDFEADIPGFVHEALAFLQDEGATRIVIDLRDNPGGFVDAVTLVASEFLEDGLVFRSVDSDQNLEYPVQPGGLAISGIDLVVLVNSGSASAAEILAAVLQERNRAEIVGTSTFGKNTVQIGFPLRNSGELRVTISRWETPEGASVAITGLSPDREVDIPFDASLSEIIDLALR